LRQGHAQRIRHPHAMALRGFENGLGEPGGNAVVVWLSQIDALLSRKVSDENWSLP
jgi:hypothetical protein